MTAISPSVVYVLKNTSLPGSITFATVLALPASQDPNGVDVQDLDGDGKPEIVVTNYNFFSLGVYKNNSTPGLLSIENPFNLPLGYYSTDVLIRDIDLDDKPDLVVSNYNPSENYITLFRNISGSTLSFENRVNRLTGRGNWRNFVAVLLITTFIVDVDVEIKAGTL